MDNNMSSPGFIGLSNVSTSNGVGSSPTVVVEASTGDKLLTSFFFAHFYSLFSDHFNFGSSKNAEMAHRYGLSFLQDYHQN